MSPDANADRDEHHLAPAGQIIPRRGRLHSVPSSHAEPEMSSDVLGRRPPHNPTMERDLLRVVVLHSDHPRSADQPGTTPSSLLDDVIATGLRPEHFYVPAHVRLWAAVLELHAEALPVDVHTVAARCSRSDVLDLLEFGESTVRSYAAVWAVLVMEDAHCRRLLPMVEEALDELLAGRLRHAREALEAVAMELAA